MNGLFENELPKRIVPPKKARARKKRPLKLLDHSLLRSTKTTKGGDTPVTFDEIQVSVNTGADQKVQNSDTITPAIWYLEDVFA